MGPESLFNQPPAPVQEHNENRERGENVEIQWKVIRHGERTKDNKLTDQGREITRERAQESGLKAEEFDAIKAIGSNADPDPETGMGRSLETAEIYAETVAGEEADIMVTRARSALNYQNFKTPVPYDHVAIYNAALPENFADLGPEEKVSAAAHAQKIVTDHLFALNTPEAMQYKQEVAGSFAMLIDRYRRMAHRLDSGSRVLMPVGSHGGTMDILLQLALVRKDQDGNVVTGFVHSDEIGGPFSPSEAFTVHIATDEEGKDKRLNVDFDNPSRPKFEEMYLDEEKLAELKEFFRDVQKEEEAA